MSKVAKITILAVIALVTVAALAFYGFKSKAPVTTDLPAPAPVSNPAPAAPKAGTPAQDQLPLLPKDNKQAIEGEIKGIDESLQNIENSISADVDGELGL